MNVAAAVLIGAAVIAGSVVWASDRAGRDTRCAGYLASNSGGNALAQLAGLEAKEGRGPVPLTSSAGYFLAGLQMAGCRFNTLSEQMLTP